MEIDDFESMEGGLHLIRLRNFQDGIGEILGELFQSESSWSHSHRIRGRWENTYLDIEKIPSVRPILNLASQFAGKLHKQPLVSIQGGQGMLKDSFWFNIMHNGEETGWHNHKARAHTSGVCYLQVPKQSGEFMYRSPCGKLRSLIPETGTLLLFPSNLNHAVAPSQSSEVRISMAFDLFTLPLELEPEDPFGGNLFY